MLRRPHWPVGRDGLTVQDTGTMEDTLAVGVGVALKCSRRVPGYLALIVILKLETAVFVGV